MDLDSCSLQCSINIILLILRFELMIIFDGTEAE